MIKFFTYLTILLLPLYLLRISLGTIGSINLLDLLLVVSVLLQFFQIKKLYSKKELFRLFKKPTFLFLFLFLFSFLVSFFVGLSSENTWDSLGELKSFFLLPILFSLGALLLREKDFLKEHLLLKLLFVSIFSQSILGYFFVVKKWTTYDDRLSLFYDSPNHFAMNLVVGITIGIFFIFKLTRKKIIISEIEKILLFLGIFSMFFCLFFTRSLGGFSSLFLVLLVFFIFFYFKKKHFVLKVCLCFFLALTFLLIFNISTLLSFFNYTPQIPASATDSRIVIYSVSRKIALENPILGIGADDFQKKYLFEQKNYPPFPQWAVPHTHNDIFHIFIKGGVLSLVFYLLFLFSVLLKTKKPFSGFFITLLALCFFGIVDVVIWKNDTSVMWWFFAILSIKLQNNSVERTVSSVCKK